MIMRSGAVVTVRAVDTVTPVKPLPTAFAVLAHVPVQTEGGAIVMGIEWLAVHLFEEVLIDVLRSDWCALLLAI